MDAVMKEYGQYVLAIIVISAIIIEAIMIFGLYNSSEPVVAQSRSNFATTKEYINNATDYDGKGMLAKCICEWLNRVM